MSHVTPPHHSDPSLNERCGHTSRLRIVEQYHVTRVDVAHQARSVGRSDLGIIGGLIGAEHLRRRCPVKTVVDPLGDGEEFLVAAHDQPANIEARTEGVADEHLEHLGHSSALGRRTDVPDRLPRILGSWLAAPVSSVAFLADHWLHFRQSVGARGPLGGVTPGGGSSKHLSR